LKDSYVRNAAALLMKTQQGIRERAKIANEYKNIREIKRERKWGEGSAQNAGKFAFKSDPSFFYAFFAEFGGFY
jgi:hypothetical protein